MDYDTRKNNVAAQLIASGVGKNVFDDAAIDTLSGNAGRDLFFAKLPSDTLLDKAADEVLFGI